MSRPRPRRRLAGALAAIFAALLAPPQASASDSGGELLSLARSPYPHRLTLYDGNGQAISPGDPAPAPFSTAATCGKCHDYATVSQGWHFNAADPKAQAGRPGEPWILTDLKTGTQIPLSDRGWKGTRRPREVGLTPWNFVRAFGRHTPGGGVGDRREESTQDPGARWQASGPQEIDCLSCHSAAPSYDPARRAAQIKEENLKWIAVATSGLASVRGTTKNQAAVSLLLAPPDATDQPGPTTLYDKSRFDPDDRATFAIPPRSPNGQCYFCHTTREARAYSPHEPRTGGDVHLAAGMSCSDCHVNGLDHATVRGYEGEDVDYHRALAAEFSCRGCHLGEDSGGEPIGGGAGRFAAPRPAHAGLPPTHLRKMSCTACHSGPLPQAEAALAQTSMAHGLGIGRKDRRPDEPPFILAPVYARGGDGKIAPHKILWPAWWGRLDAKGALTPMSPEEVAQETGAALAARPANLEEWRPLSAEEIAKGLQALNAAKESRGEAVYMAAGRMFQATAEGKLESSENAAAAPYSWPIGHDVRPASQALGARGCGDCHANDSPFFYASIPLNKLVQLDGVSPRRMIDFEGLDADAIAALNRSFAMRTALKVVGYACSALLAAILLVYALLGLRRLTAALGGGA